MHRQLIIFICALGLLAAGCSVHEVPEGGDENPSVALTLNIDLDETMPLHSALVYSTRADKDLARYIVRLYPYVNDTYLKDAPFEFVATEADLTDRSYTIGVLPLNYHVEVWADWTRGETPFYDAADFGKIVLETEDYTGADEHRDAFCGEMDLDLSVYQENLSSHEATIVLARPNARFCFFSDDREEFLRYWAGVIALDNGTNVKDPDSIDLNDYVVRVYYPQYLPSEYDSHEGSVTDSATGVWYETKMKDLRDGTIEIAWDWVLATGDASSVVVSLAFFDQDGKFINRLDNILVPLAPGHLTTITGKLLTSNIQSGITIDPSFDGEFIVHIN